MGEKEPRYKTSELIAKVIELRRQGMGVREIARRLGVHHSTVQGHIGKYQPHMVAGEPPPKMPINVALDKTDVDGSVEMLKLDRPATVEELMRLCKLDPRVWIPQHYTPNSWQGFYKLKEGGEHRKVQLYQSKASFKRAIAEEVERAILEFTEEHVRAIPPRKPVKASRRDGFMVAWGLHDAHLGAYAWNSETGNDFDISIARNRVLNSIDDMLKELALYPIDKFLMPIGSDYLHYDSCRNQTAFGDHALDVDSRFAKVYLVGLECLSYMVDRALELCNDIELLYVPGNHDYTASFTLTAALAQRYRNEKRVKVDMGANPRKYRTFGGTLLGFTHGSGINKNQLAIIFSTEAQKDWSNSSYREVQIGHTHQRAEQSYGGVVPTNGILIRTNPALCANDYWHHSHGFLGEPMKSIEAWRYDHVGYRGSHVAWARDQARSK